MELTEHTVESKDALYYQLVEALRFNYAVSIENDTCLICGEYLTEKELKYIAENDKEYICSECERLFP